MWHTIQSLHAALQVVSDNLSWYSCDYDHFCLHFRPYLKKYFIFLTSNVKRPKSQDQDLTVHDQNHKPKIETKTITTINKKLSYCWETVRRESMPRIAEMDVEMTT